MIVSMVTSGPGVEMVGAGAARQSARPGTSGGFAKRAADQLQRASGQSEAHAALGGIHRLGDAEAEGPQPMAEGEASVPSRSPVSATDHCRRSGSATTWAAAKAMRG